MKKRMESDIRQQPGYACEECRRRKTRCDRARPQCAICLENGLVCVISDKRPQRGPKKGQLKTLRSRIATLEQQLDNQLGFLNDPSILVGGQFELAPSPPGPDVLFERDRSCIDFSTTVDDDPGRGSEDGELSHPPSGIVSPNFAVSPLTEWLDGALAWPAITEMPPSSGTFNQFSSDQTSTPRGDSNISDLMWADIVDPHRIRGRLFTSADRRILGASSDQLYFDRVHGIVPIIQKRHYFTWVGQAKPSPAQACLRSAMRAVASAVSARFSNFSDNLYAETRRMLEELEAGEHGTGLPWVTAPDTSSVIPLEQIQAWLLLVHFDILRARKHHVSPTLTASRAFRLVQLSRLYDVDAADLSTTTGSETASDDRCAELEEKRRAFWLAFALDRFLAACYGCSLTIHEEMIRARLPAPETDFQTSRPTTVVFLAEALDKGSPSQLSPFAESVVLAALLGRCTIHRQLARSSGGSTKEAREFWDRHKWLDGAAEKRTQPLSPSALFDHDHMLVFLHVLARGIIIHLHSTAEIMQWQIAEHQYMAVAYERRAYQAAVDIARLTKAVPWLSSFKAHPFLPCSVSYAACFLMKYAQASSLAPANEEKDEDLQHLLGLLQRLRDVNNLARDVLDKLQTDRRLGSN